MAPLRALNLPILTHKVLQFLAANGILSVEDFLVHDLYTLAALTEQQTNSEVLKQAIAEILSYIDSQHSQWLNGAQLLENMQQAVHVLPTGCEGLDSLLGGGLLEGTLTELVGPSASGKTQICLRATSHIAYHSQAAVMYLDTCNSFSSKRIAQFLNVLAKSSFKSKDRQRDIERVMKGIFHYNVFDVYCMLDILYQIESSMHTQGKNERSRVHLIIVDSVSSVITPILSGSNLQGLERLRNLYIQSSCKVEQERKGKTSDAVPMNTMAADVNFILNDVDKMEPCNRKQMHLCKESPGFPSGQQQGLLDSSEGLMLFQCRGGCLKGSGKICDSKEKLKLPDSAIMTIERGYDGLSGEELIPVCQVLEENNVSGQNEAKISNKRLDDNCDQLGKIIQRSLLGDQKLSTQNESLDPKSEIVCLHKKGDPTRISSPQNTDLQLISAFFRPEHGQQQEYRNDVAVICNGHSLMISLGVVLKKLALEYSVAVLITNHIVVDKTGTSKPALGESWKSMPHVRLLLSRDPVSNICDISLLKHTSMVCDQQASLSLNS